MNDVGAIVSIGMGVVVGLFLFMKIVSQISQLYPVVTLRGDRVREAIRTCGMEPFNAAKLLKVSVDDIRTAKFIMSPRLHQLRYFSVQTSTSIDYLIGFGNDPVGAVDTGSLTPGQKAVWFALYDGTWDKYLDETEQTK